MESLIAIKIKERGNRRVGNEYLPKLTYPPVLHQSLTVADVHVCLHMSSVTSDRVWISDHLNNLILTKTTGNTKYRVRGFCKNLHGWNTLNSENELFYIDENFNINKVSKDMITLTTFIEVTDLTQEPRCVYCSPSTGDLLVGMFNYHTMTGNVTRYNHRGQVTQIIQHDNIGLELYNDPYHIIQNNNGDVVVSDYDNEFGAVVVTEQCTGIHRFSYTGPSS